MKRVRVLMLALSAVALLAGCGTGTSNSTNSTTNSTNSTTNAGANASPTAAQASPTSTPITSNAGSTPTETFKAYYEAIKAKDAEAVKRLFSKETMKMLEEQAKQSNKTVDEVFKEGMEDASKEVPATMPEVRNEKIDGDTATIEIKDDKTDKWETFHLVKEDGQWKISFGK